MALSLTVTVFLEIKTDILGHNFTCLNLIFPSKPNNIFTCVEILNPCFIYPVFHQIQNFLFLNQDEVLTHFQIPLWFKTFGSHYFNFLKSMFRGLNRWNRQLKCIDCCALCPQKCVLSSHLPKLNLLWSIFLYCMFIRGKTWQLVNSKVMKSLTLKKGKFIQNLLVICMSTMSHKCAINLNSKVMSYG